MSGRRCSMVVCPHVCELLAVPKLLRLKLAAAEAFAAAVRVRAFAMADSAGQWRLRDFGEYQQLRNTITGQSRRVYGEGACFEDGPFELFADSEFEQPFLLGTQGGDADRSIHLASETGMAAATEVLRNGRADWQISYPPDGEKPACAAWATDLAHDSQAFALSLLATRPFSAEFARFSVPANCGGKPVSLWIFSDGSWIGLPPMFHAGDYRGASCSAPCGLGCGNKA